MSNQKIGGGVVMSFTTASAASSLAAPECSWMAYPGRWLQCECVPAGGVVHPRLSNAI